MKLQRRLLTAAALAVAAAFGGTAAPPLALAQETAFADNLRAWSLGDYEATGKTVPAFKQAPAFDADVAAGKLPPVEERLPVRADVEVVQPRDAIGPYGGTIRYNAINPQSFGNVGYSAWDVHLAGVTTNWEDVYPDIARSIVMSDDNLVGHRDAPRGHEVERRRAGHRRRHPLLLQRHRRAGRPAAAAWAT